MFKFSAASFLLLLCLFRPINSYCIYNNAGIGFHIVQSSTNTHAGLNENFSKYMTIGQRECCSYTNTDCSSPPNSDNTVIFSLTTDDGYEYDFQLQAGGYVNVTDATDGSTHPRVTLCSPDGSQALTLFRAH